MTALGATSVARVVTTVRRGSVIADLARLYETELALATAPLPASPGALLHATTLVDAGERRVMVQVDTPDGTPARGALERLAVHDSEHAPAWIAYVEGVVEVFASLLGAESVGVRLVVSETPHCPRFHVDRVTARGVITVIGRGTEWLESAYVDRRWLGHAGGPDGDANSRLVRDWEQLQRAQPGELAVFKGTAWDAASERAVVHRSPPPNGVWRVVLTLDWLN